MLPADGLISRAFPLSGTQHGGGLVARAAATAHHEGDGFVLALAVVEAMKYCDGAIAKDVLATI